MIRHFATLMAAALLATAALVPPGIAGPGHDEGTAEIGRPGEGRTPDRTVAIVMGDNFFEPERITVTPGETIRFVLDNRGVLLHEFSLGTAAMHEHHQAEMLAMMQAGLLTPTGIHDHAGHGHGMDGHHGQVDDPAAMAMTHDHANHDHANGVLVAPGEQAELVWTFTEAADLQFACNVPGHYQAGMHGDIRFVR